MSYSRKLILVLFPVCAHIWVHPSFHWPPETDSIPQGVQSSQRPPNSDENISGGQNSSTALQDSAKLEPTQQPQPTYPSEAKAQKLQGQVIVRAFVSEAGEVERVEVVSGDPILARSAIDAVEKWKFRPFIKNGKPVKVSTKLPFNFALNDKVEDVKTDVAPRVAHVAPEVILGRLVHRVDPVYPGGAHSLGIQGSVVLHARINEEGRIADLKVLSGPKELAVAAIAAVQQWRYTPYLLLGKPVEVDTEITVNFQLHR
jgi:TonB family protein